MIPINEAIEAGSWLTIYKNEDLLFRFKLNNFEKFDTDGYTRGDKPFPEGNYWLLNCEIVNTTKQEIETWEFRKALIIVDEDDCEFSIFSHMSENTDQLKPKIKKTLAYVYELPENFEQLFIAFKDGQIIEV